MKIRSAPCRLLEIVTNIMEHCESGEFIISVDKYIYSGLHALRR